MHLPTTLPRGCTRSRGQADVPHLRSLGGDLAQRANRLYMLTVRRESLVNKKRSLEKRLADLNLQLKEIESDLMATEGKYGSILRRGRKRKGASDKKEWGNGRSVKAMALKY